MVSRPVRGTRWVTCALVLASLVVPVTAAPRKPIKKKPRVSIATCASFDQVQQDDAEAVDLVIDNQCDVRLACSVSWTLTCAPEGKQPRRFQRGAVFGVERRVAQSTLASAAECGHQGWVLDDVTWSCRPEPIAPAK